MNIKITILLLLFSLSAVGQTTYYVSPTGDDNNPGTLAEPWGTWGKAFSSSRVAGDTVYFRGGVYYNTGTVREATGITGTRDNPVVFINYPGETPILDGSTRAVPGSGLMLYYAEYVKLIGLTIRNQFQIAGYASDNLYVTGFKIYLAKHITLERCVAHNTGRRGYEFNSPDTLYVTDCDAYNNADTLSSAPGNGGDGYIITGLSASDTTDYALFTRCRSWHNSDDGWDVHTNGYIEFDSCYAISNGYLQYGNGTGFKLNLSATLRRSMLSRLVTNSVAAFNKRTGFTTNDLNDFPLPTHIYNNTSYSNGEGYIVYRSDLSGVTLEDQVKRVFKNNISYQDDYPTMFLNLSTNEYNSWNTPPGVTVTDADFLSVPDSLEFMDVFTADRGTDGSLPDFGNLLHLASGSDMVGAVPDLGYGTDLGAFQYTTPSVVTVPNVITGDSYSIGSTSATIEGNSNDNGGGTVTAKGVCWNTTGNPTIANNKTNHGTGTGVFNSTISGLTVNTTYYVRAYATNEAGTSYGDQISIRTVDKVYLKLGDLFLYIGNKVIKF